MSEIVLAADIGGTNLRMAAVGQDGNIVNRVKIETPESGNREEIVSAVMEAGHTCMAGLKSIPSAVAIAVPGTIATSDGTISQAPNLPDLNGFDLASAISKGFDIPVVIENDANAAAIGEYWLGGSKGSDVSVMITLGTGVGGGIIIHDQVLRGKDGTAGELGHINVEPNGPKCGCGSMGCLEQYASATAITRMAHEEIKLALSDIEGYSGGFDAANVFEAATQAQPWAVSVFEKQGRYLGIAIADLINLLNPDVIVIGGGVAAAWEAFMPSVRKQVNKRAYAEPAARAKIVPAALADNAGILGAACVGFRSTKIDVVKPG